MSTRGRYLSARNLHSVNEGSAVTGNHGGTQLSDREKQVLGLIASGNTSKEIAHTLGIAFRTVVSHRYNIQLKLGARNTADLTRAAIRMRLIDDLMDSANGQPSAGRDYGSRSNHL